MPNPRLRSSRQNQRAMATFEASASASAPAPTSRRPDAMMPIRGLTAVIARPANTRTLKIAIDRLVPIRSMTTPQMSIATMFGKL